MSAMGGKPSFASAAMTPVYRNGNAGRVLGFASYRTIHNATSKCRALVEEGTTDLIGARFCARIDLASLFTQNLA